MSEPEKALQYKKTLVLNADGVPIAIVPWYKAIGMLHVKQTAVILTPYDNNVVDSKGKEWELPAVIILKNMVVKHLRKVPFNRKNVLLRDKLSCCYCGKKFLPKELTFDHVVPRSKWSEKDVQRTGHKSPTNWDNIVSACKKCNTRKADKTVEECGMKLIRKPRKPTRAEISMSFSTWERIPTEWSPYMKSIHSLAGD